MPSSPLLLRAVLPLVVAIIAMVMDASPMLFLYDSILPKRNRFLTSFRNQTIWVTGASSGIGLELLCLLMDAETKHVILSSRQQEALEASVVTCRSRMSSGSSTVTKVSFVPYDAATRDTKGSSSATAIIDRVLTLTEDRHLDRVFLNAGIYQLSPALSTPLDLSRRVLRVNYESPVELAVTLLQQQQHQQHPLHMIVVASILSRGAHALVSSYAASKHALRGFFHSLATELSADDVRIDVACPAGTATQLWENSGAPEVKKNQLMSAQRVAWLIVTGATGPYALFWETWIGQPIQLVWTAMASHAPSLFQASTLLFGWCRVQFWERDGTDVVDPFTLLRAFFWEKKE